MTALSGLKGSGYACSRAAASSTATVRCATCILYRIFVLHCKHVKAGQTQIWHSSTRTLQSDTPLFSKLTYWPCSRGVRLLGTGMVLP